MDQLYEMTKDPEKLKAYPGFKRALAMGVADDMAFYHDLPYDEIKAIIAEAKECIMGHVPRDVLESSEVSWEHIGSTSIKGQLRHNLKYTYLNQKHTFLN